MASVSQLSNDELRRQLIEQGVSLGPVTASTRPIYERKLKDLISQRKRSGSSLKSAAKKMKVEPPKARPAKLPPRAAATKVRQRPKPAPARPSQARNGRREAIRATMNKGKCEPKENTYPVDGNSQSSFSAPDLSEPVPYMEEDQNEVEESMFSLGEGGSSEFSFHAPHSPPAVNEEQSQVGASPFNFRTMLQQGVQVVRNFLGGGPSGSTMAERDLSIRSSSINSLGEELLEDMDRHANAPANFPDSSPSPPPRRYQASQIKNQKATHVDPSPSSSLKYDWELEPEDVHICRRVDGSLWSLGKGGFGVVYKGVMGGVDEVAVKVLHMQTPVVVGLFKQEIDMISKLRHRHIVQFYGACVDPSTVYMVTELMQTDLFSALRRLSQQYRWSGVYGAQVAVGIASGIHYLHSRKPAVVHRDIKSPNILLMDGMAKIADVGLARTKSESDMTAQRGFTAAWAAPEVVYRRRATEKIDIWSFGIILWEIVTGQPPRVGSLSMPLGTVAPLKSLYGSCISGDPQLRPQAVDVVQTLRTCSQIPI